MTRAAVRIRALRAAVLLGAAGLAGCASGRSVVPVVITPAALPRPEAVADFRNPEAAVRGIAAILTTDLGLPLPPAVTLYVYASRDRFTQGLVKDAGLGSARAAELAHFAVGVGERGQLLLQHVPASPRDPEWLRLIAHELTHVAQIELAGGEGLAEQWLAEGMAEWVAFTTLERLDLDTVGARRAAALDAIRDGAALRAARLDLDTLGTPGGFTGRQLRDGAQPTYQLAFLMADYLIQREGFLRVVDYFRSFGVRPRRRENFRDAFGQTLGDFEQDVRAHLLGLTR